jgi:hypothetical protein
MKSTKLFAAFVAAVVFSVVQAPAQVTGSGTKGTIPVWVGTTKLGNSLIVQTGGNVGIGTNKPGAKLDVESASTTKPAVTGNSFGTKGNTTGVLGSAASPKGIGVQGYAATGGFFQTPSSTGIGVFGIATSTTGTVNAGNTATSGFASALYGSTSSSGAVVALLRAQAGGNIVTGQFGVGTQAVNVFRVDSTGKGFFDGGTQTGGADFAESVAVAKEFTQHEPGDLLIVDAAGKRQLKLSEEPYSTLVAGIYSTKPGVLATAHKMDETTANEIPLAIVGIVPCKVSAENGAIQPGDLLVTSSTPGHAMKGTDRSRMLGAVVGKALEPLSEGKAVIEVLVTLQ